MLHTLRSFLILLISICLLLLCSLRTYAGATQVTEDSVEGKNVKAAADFISEMGDKEKADNILKWLKDGKLYWDDNLDKADGGETGPISGDITIVGSFIHSSRNKKARETPFDPEKDFDSITNLARVLFHEKIHAHQSYFATHLPSFWGGTVAGGKNAEEYEAWTETIYAMDRWILNLFDKYKEIPADKKEEQIAILKKILTLISQKRNYLSDFMGNNNYHGFGDDDAGGKYGKIKDYFQLLDDKLKELEERLRKELEQLENPHQMAPRSPKEAKSSLPDPERLLKQVAGIEQAVERNAPERIPRDDEVEFRITPRPNSEGRILDLYFVNKSKRHIQTEIPVGMPIGRPDSTSQVMVTVQPALLNCPPNSSVTVPLLVNNRDRAQVPSLNGKEILYVTLPESPSPTQATNSALMQGTVGAQLVGLVYDKDSRPGDRVTVSLTTDPKKYANIPALGVIEIKVPASAGATAQDVLKGLVVDLGDGRQQPANQPLTSQIAKGATSIPVKVGWQGNPKPAAQSSVPITQGQSNITVMNTGKASDFTTPPVVQTISFIRGPLSGDANTTRIMVDNQPAAIIAGSTTTIYFDLPAGTSAGSHQLIYQDGSRSASFPIVRMNITGSIDQPELKRGQKTNYETTVQIGPLPDSVWQHGGGVSPELTNVANIQKLAPGFHIPQPGEPAVVLERVENASRDTVSIKPSQNETVVRALHQQDFQNNQFTNRGEIQSKKSGSILLNLLAEAFFAPIPGQEVTGGVIAGGPNNPIARQFDDSVDIKGCKPVSCGAPVIGPGVVINKAVTCSAVTACPLPCQCNVYEALTGTQNRWKKAKPDVLRGGEIAFNPLMDYACFCTQ